MSCGSSAVWKKRGLLFNFPWYWTEAHDAEKNVDRSNYNVFTISNWTQLEELKNRTGSKPRLAIELKPMLQELMRDMKFIGAVGNTARGFEVPVILAGSTLGHAYCALRRQGCTVVTRGEKEHSRIRRIATFGKNVRDKIPDRIAMRRETGVTRKIPNELKKNFLTSKLLEEALEVRNARTVDEKRMELADLYEVFRALAQSEGLSVGEIIMVADDKREKVGGFDDGTVLFQTGIMGKRPSISRDAEKPLTQVLARKVSSNSYELPFTFFGFMDTDQSRSLVFEELGIRLDVTLRSDRIELEASREAEQLELQLDLTIKGLQ